MGVYANAKQYALATNGSATGFVTLPAVDGLVVGATGWVRSSGVNRAVGIVSIDPVTFRVSLRNADVRFGLSDMSDLTTAQSAKLFQDAGVVNRDPSDLAQAGGSAESGTEVASAAIRTITVAQTLTEDDEENTVACDGTFAVTLPTAGGRAGAKFFIINVGAGVITINTTSGQTVSGDASGVITLATWDSLTVQSTGINYITV